MPTPNLGLIDATPSFPEEYQDTSFFEEDQALDGSRQAIQLLPGKRRSWKLHYINQTESQRTSFEAFMDSIDGGYLPFDWTYRGVTYINVCIKDPTLGWSRNFTVSDWTIDIYTTTVL